MELVAKFGTLHVFSLMQTRFFSCADVMLCICRRSFAKLSSAEAAVETNVTTTDTHPACKLVTKRSLFVDPSI